METVTTNTTISPLRQRMTHDMMMRGLGPHTQRDYIRHVRRLAAFLGRPPDTATEEDLRRFQIHQHEAGASIPTINGTVSALRFFYSVTLRRRDLARGLVAMRPPYKAREVLSVEEAARLLEAAPGIKYRAALGVAYGAGLRVSEVAHLKVDDIDSKRMLIRVEQGKVRYRPDGTPLVLPVARQWPVALVNHALLLIGREVASREASPSAGVIDSQSVRTTESGGPRGYDAGKKIKRRKRHILTDTEGNLVHAVIHTADIQDRDGAPLVLAEIIRRFPWLRHVFADGGYAGDKLRQALCKIGKSKWIIEIIKRSDKARGFEVLPRRWVVERTFAWLGRNRRLGRTTKPVCPVIVLTISTVMLVAWVTRSWL